MFLEFCSNWLRLITLSKNVTVFWSCGPDFKGALTNIAINPMTKGEKTVVISPLRSMDSSNMFMFVRHFSKGDTFCGKYWPTLKMVLHLKP